MKRSTLILLLVLTGFVNSLQAQTYVTDFKRTADNYFAQKDYYSAAQYYSKALGTFTVKPGEYKPYLLEKDGKTKQKKLKDYEQVVYRLAESYRMYNDFGNAAKWYAEAINFDPVQFPLVKYWYGVCLRANAKTGEDYEKALAQFQQFQQSYKGTDDYSNRTKIEIQSCEFAIEEMKHPPRYEVVKVAGNINQGGANYAPVPVSNNMFYFTSSRPDSTLLVKKSNPFINTLYIARGDNSSFDSNEKLSIPMEKGTEQGVAAIAPDGNTLYVTRWTSKDGNKHSSIYRSTKSGNGWTEPQALDATINAAGYSAKEPFVTSDGKYFLFVSDRPGGMGKFDVWYCTISSGGTLSAANNMGNTINTKEEESAPFFDPMKQTLVFSSNGRVGFGGQDFFSSKGNFGGWSVPENMGYPLNSAKDDQYYAALQAKNALQKGYISSDRESICCLEIFAVKRKVKMAGGLVMDCETGKPLEGAKITLLDSTQRNILETQTTSYGGNYMFELEMNKKYKVLIEKDNYFSKNFNFSTEQLSMVDSMMNPTVCLKRFEMNKPIVINDIFYDYNKATLRQESKLILDSLYYLLLDNPKMEIELGAHTDSKGTDAYNLKLSNARAKSCVDYLISKGIPTTRVVSKGYGEARPVAPNTLPNGKDNPDGRQLNRRTEFKVLRN
ncbi:OmpA family protein [Chitinophaga sp. SYP-B3965]|uniref:OmpA family protein n=1 Tax=Chitinophaga sp. SYP-B3965 TaxID=2663120 RepID=UPI0015674F5E|nr:OmpA family protein [Chitinophaga sp. SYP-B3965]